LTIEATTDSLDFNGTSNGSPCAVAFDVIGLSKIEVGIGATLSDYGFLKVSTRLGYS
jgi:hypothetical protein